MTTDELNEFKKGLKIPRAVKSLIPYIVFEIFEGKKLYHVQFLTSYLGTLKTYKNCGITFTIVEKYYND
jgi:hypothetical protein